LAIRRFWVGAKSAESLGSDYFDALNKVYADRVPVFGNLVCYWFAKSLTAIEGNGLGAAGLVTTNSIHGGANPKCWLHPRRPNARDWLCQPNPHGKSNAEVVRPLRTEPWTSP
jgi:hypothetical protein